MGAKSGKKSGEWLGGESCNHEGNAKPERIDRE